MATKPTRNAPKKDGWQPKGFVNLYLTENQLSDAFKQFEKWEKTEKALNDEMANGYKFTFSYDNRSGSVVCTVACKDETSENYGWLLSSFAPSWQEALILSIYKHLIVLDGHWGDNETKASAQRYG